MNVRKLKSIDKIIIVATLTGAIFIIGFVWSIKRTNRDYMLPADFEGWVTVVHQVPNAPPLDVKDGALQVEVPESGIVHTSSSLEQGWSRNQFFQKTSTGWDQIPSKPEIDGKPALFMHRHEFYHYAHYSLLDTVAVGTDTIMWDGARLIKYAEDDRVYNPGQKTIETFYISREPKPVTFNPPANPNDLSDKPYREEYNR